MTELVCKHCESGFFVKNGMAHGRQRHPCKACGRSSTATPARGRPPAMKALAVLPHALGDASQGMTAKLLGVSHVAVYEWVRAAGEDPLVDRALGHAVGRHRADRRDVALRGREKNKVWLWRAYDPVARRALAWELGGRDDGDT